MNDLYLTRTFIKIDGFTKLYHILIAWMDLMACLLSFENDFMMQPDRVFCFTETHSFCVTRNDTDGPAHFMTQGNEGNNYSQRQRILNKGRY